MTMSKQQIYHVYFGHDGREYRELGHSLQIQDRIVKTAVNLCNIGTPQTLLADRPVLLSYPDETTGYLYMICCSSMNDFSNRQALFYHVLTCPLSVAQRYGINAFSLYDSGCFVTHYNPGDILEIAPLTCQEQTYTPTKAPFVMTWNPGDKPVVVKADQPAQLVRGLLTGETVNRLKWAEFSYKELPNFDLYVLSNPDLSSIKYSVRDASGKRLSFSSLKDSETPAVVSESIQPASEKSAVASSDNPKTEQKNIYSIAFNIAMTLFLALFFLMSALWVVNRIKALENRVATLNNEISALREAQSKASSKATISEESFLTKNEFNTQIESRLIEFKDSNINNKYVSKDDFDLFKNELKNELSRHYPGQTIPAPSPSGGHITGGMTPPARNFSMRIQLVDNNKTPDLNKVSNFTFVVGDKKYRSDEVFSLLFTLQFNQPFSFGIVDLKVNISFVIRAENGKPSPWIEVAVNGVKQKLYRQPNSNIYYININNYSLYFYIESK